MPKVLCLLVFLLLSVRTTHAATVFEDRFDKQLDWTLVRNSTHDDANAPCLTPNGIPSWKTVDESVEITINDSIPCSTEIVPNENAGNDLRAFRVSLRMYVSDPKMDRNLLLRWQDKKNHILFHFFGSGVSVGKILNGKVAVLEDSARGYAFQNNRWYDLQMEYDLSLRSIKLSINGSLVIDAKEPTNTSQIEKGKPGLAASVGAVRYSFVRFDDFVVESLEKTNTLDVPLIKQTDERWKLVEYDSARDWAPTLPTIGRWGCALTSGVGILQFYGIQKLPDGQPLNPGTLNDWLLQQADGYYPGGSINWRALSRLSAIHGREHGTPTLEMTYENPSEKITWLKQKIGSGVPVILAQPGHFVTAHGYGPGEDDIALRDPFYDRLRLAEYGGTFVSARLFTPSYTDLSAITVVVPLSTNVHFLRAGGEEVPVDAVAEYPLSDPLSLTKQRPYLIYDLAKPSQPLTLVVEPTTSLIPIWIVSYSQEGTATVLRKILSYSIEPVHFSVDTTVKKPMIVTTRQEIEALTLQQLASLFSTQLIRHPALVTSTLEYQARLHQSTEVEAALAFERGYMLLLQSAQKNGWGEPQTIQALQDHFHALILEKFP